MVDNRLEPISQIAGHYHVKADKLRRHYKKYTSGFKQWNQLEHCEDYLLYPDNIGEHLSIDEVSLSKGELYTFVTNKAAKSKKESLVASIKGTRSQDIANILNKISEQKRAVVKDITMDMANNMGLAVKNCFPQAKLIIDRFHVVKLIEESLQIMRTTARRKAIDEENKLVIEAKHKGLKYLPKEYENGDSAKQLLARCRYVIAKKPDEWTENQKLRAEILFKNHPQIQHAYHIVLEFRNIYKQTHRVLAQDMFLKWIDKIFEQKLTLFYTAANSVKCHLNNILNFFNDRLTNANAESFNAKVKLFRANLRGVTDNAFFLFRLHNFFS